MEAVNSRRDRIFKKVLIYGISILIPLGVGGLSALITSGNMDIYSELETPPLSPPAILFPIVWTVLYVLMGISAGIIFEKRERFGALANSALFVYLGSLVVNFAWSIIFFNFNVFLLALVWLVFLFFLIVRTIVLYSMIDSRAAILQLPYALWVAFAGYLNLGIWILA
jgi:tryptophan-rich sensory protein